MIVCSKRPRPPPSRTSTLWSTCCSAIEPRPPAAFVSFEQAVMSAGPWHPRSEMCDVSTAGVASVISAVETSPTFRPRFCASSRTVVRFVPGYVDGAARPLRDPLVEGLLAGRPARAGRRRVRVVVGLVRRLGGRLHRPRRVEAGVPGPVDVQLVLDTLVVARGGDLLRPHAVAQQEDHVLRPVRRGLRLRALRRRERAAGGGRSHTCRGDHRGRGEGGHDGLFPDHFGPFCLDGTPGTYARSRDNR